MSAARRADAWLTAAALAAALVGPGAASADEPLVELARDAPIAAGDGWVAWSSYERGRYRLTLRAPDGEIRPAPLPASSLPWDVALGPDARNRPVAVYRRCGRRGCDLHRLHLRSGRHMALAGASSPRHDEATPAISGATLAFTRRIGTCDVVYVKDLGSRRPSRRLRSPCLRVPEGQLAVRGANVVVSSLRDVGANTVEAAVAVLRAGRRRRVLLRRRFSQEADLYGQVAIAGRHVVSVRYGMRAPPVFVRVPLAGGRVHERPARRELTGAFAVLGDGVLYVERQGAGGEESCSDFSPVPCRLVHAPASPFGTAARTLTPSLTIAAEDTEPSGTPVLLRGVLRRPVVVAGRVDRHLPVSGVTVELRRRVGSPDERFERTSYRDLTDAAGRFTIAVPARFRAAPWFTAVALTAPVETWAGRGVTG